MNVDDGQVELKLAGEKYTLRPSLGALQKIDRHFGSLRAAIEQCGALSVNAMVSVVVTGAALDKREAKRVPELIYSEGLVNVAGPITEYLANLLDPTGSASQEPDDDEGKD